MCEHLHEATSRYEHDAKLLTLLLICPACGTERVVERLEYEPRFKPIYPVPNSERSNFVDAPEPALLLAA
jgi:hypothetical protein